MYCSLDDLKTESDVEQLFVLPLLTSLGERGLGYNASDLKTKHDIRRLIIDKGQSEKLYHPDYAIVIAGVPVFIIEVKKPSDSFRDALREARLYANELNARFPSGVNPCRRVVATNGKSFATSPADSDAPDLELGFSDFDVTNVKFNRLIDVLSRGSSQRWADALAQNLTPRPLERAVGLIGGQSIRDENIGYNDFGSKLALDYRTIFTPESTKDRAHIVRNAYVSSERREHFVDEIDRIIKSAVVSSIPGSRLIENTSAPNEIIAALRAGRKLENEIMLLVGGRGSGKSTFIDYCRLVKLPEDLLQNTVWAHLNYNASPKNKEIVERWTMTELAASLRAEHPNQDFLEDPEVVEKLYSVELRRLRKVALAKLTPGTEAYETRVADYLMQLQADPLQTAKAMCRYLCGERRKLLVVVFDNSDKRDRDEQLIAFELARWIQGQIPCLIILPIRDVTYELCKDKLPLDSAIKDLVFRIDPPPFSRVLRKRIDLVLHDLQLKSGAKMLDFSLDNKIKVSYPATELGFYLASIYKSLYEYDRLVRSLLLGLAGRNMRRAMEIFLEFCRSGHIGSGQYLVMKAARGHHSLPYEVVARVLLRRNRRFFDGNKSFLANLFQCDPSDAKPDSFVRVAVLQWLRNKVGERGPTGARGFFRYSSMAGDLIPFGHDSLRVEAETKYLIEHGCILTEHQQPELRSDGDLIRIAPSGIVHLQMTEDPAYIAACAEETWVTDRKLAETVATRIARFGPSAHYSPVTMMLNAKEFVSYLAKRALDEVATPEAYLENTTGDARQTIYAVAAAMQRTYAKFKESGNNWDTLDEQLAVGMECDAGVVGVQEYGAFLKLDGGPVGLLHVSKLPADRALSNIQKGDRLRVSILWSDKEAKKLSLGYVRDLGSDDALEIAKTATFKR